MDTRRKATSCGQRREIQEAGTVNIKPKPRTLLGRGHVFRAVDGPGSGQNQISIDACMHACNHPEANVTMCKDGLPHTPQDRSGV